MNRAQVMFLLWLLVLVIYALMVTADASYWLIVPTGFWLGWHIKNIFAGLR